LANPKNRGTFHSLFYDGAARLCDVNHLATDQQATSSAAATPNAMLVWNNQARLSLPRGLAVWLGFLVVVCLGSGWFVREFAAARWVLGGFVVSHGVVFLLPVVTRFTMRRGFVSLMHVVCWSPGMIATIADAEGRQADAVYAGWSYVLIAVVSISFVFDLRDAGTYLYWLAKGRKSEE
jgi:hypothetical protein